LGLGQAAVLSDRREAATERVAGQFHGQGTAPAMRAARRNGGWLPLTLPSAAIIKPASRGRIYPFRAWIISGTGGKSDQHRHKHDCHSQPEISNACSRKFIGSSRSRLGLSLRAHVRLLLSRGPGRVVRRLAQWILSFREKATCPFGPMAMLYDPTPGAAAPRASGCGS
jgi:hypothetical protein